MSVDRAFLEMAKKLYMRSNLIQESFCLSKYLFLLACVHFSIDVHVPDFFIHFIIILENGFLLNVCLVDIEFCGRIDVITVEFEL